MGAIAMVKKLCICLCCFAIFAIITNLTCCDDDPFWCENCKKWYDTNAPHMLTIGSVDYILCEKCYKDMVDGAK